MTDDERFSLLVSVWARTRHAGARQAYPGGRPDERRLHARRTAAGRPGAADERRQHGRHQPRLPPGRHRHGAAGVHRARRELQSGAGRAGGGVLGREARSRGFNISWPAASTSRATRATAATSSTSPRTVAQRRARRRVGQRDPGRRRDLDAQALHAELQRDQPPLAGRDHRSGCPPRVRPAGVPDRHRALAARLDHDRATTRSTASTPAATAS